MFSFVRLYRQTRITAPFSTKNINISFFSSPSSGLFISTGAAHLQIGSLIPPGGWRLYTVSTVSVSTCPTYPSNFTYWGSTSGIHVPFISWTELLRCTVSISGIPQRLQLILLLLYHSLSRLHLYSYADTRFYASSGVLFLESVHIPIVGISRLCGR